MNASQFDPVLVQPLARAENQLLQVLVNAFQIRRKGQGFELQVEFDDTAPSIWLRHAKRYLRAALPRDRRAAVQCEIDRFMASNDEVFEYDNPSFPFRLGNGGTLPVIRMKGTDYLLLPFLPR
jgi:hypothetical protein